MAQVPIVKHTEIAYGPQHRAELEAFLGQPVGWHDNVQRAPVIAQCIYLTPHYEVRRLDNGQIAVIFENGISHSRVMVLADYATYLAWDKSYWSAFPDPETGRHPLPQEGTDTPR